MNRVDFVVLSTLCFSCCCFFLTNVFHLCCNFDQSSSSWLGMFSGYVFASVQQIQSVHSVDFFIFCFGNRSIELACCVRCGLQFPVCVVTHNDCYSDLFVFFFVVTEGQQFQTWKQNLWNEPSRFDTCYHTPGGTQVMASSNQRTRWMNECAMLAVGNLPRRSTLWVIHQEIAHS